MSDVVVLLPGQPLALRLGAIRRRRLAVRLTSATTAVLWLAGLVLLIVGVGGGLLTSR